MKRSPIGLLMAVALVMLVAAPTTAVWSGRDTRITSGAGQEPRDGNDDGVVVSDDQVNAMIQLQTLIRATGALGLYTDEKSGHLVVLVPSSGSSTFSTEKSDALGLSVDLATANLEPSDIVAIKSRVAAVHDSSEVHPFTVAAAFDARMGKVRLFTDAPRQAFDVILASYPDLLVYEFTKLRRDSRSYDIEPHWGGAELALNSDLWKCSSGFAVENTNGSDRMVTAGHCFTLGQTVNSSTGSTFGTVRRRDSFPTNDFELLGGSGDAVQMGPVIYIGGSSGVKAKVYGAETAAFETAYCFSGATSYERCIQYMLDDDILYQDSEGDTPHTQLFGWSEAHIYTRYSACGGDSGAPFYRFTTGGPGIADSHVKIVGIVIAGNCAVAESGGLTFTESWDKIHQEYDVTIKSN